MNRKIIKVWRRPWIWLVLGASLVLPVFWLHHLWSPIQMVESYDRFLKDLLTELQAQMGEDRTAEFTALLSTNLPDDSYLFLRNPELASHPRLAGRARALICTVETRSARWLRLAEDGALYSLDFQTHITNVLHFLSAYLAETADQIEAGNWDTALGKLESAGHISDPIRPLSMNYAFYMRNMFYQFVSGLFSESPSARRCLELAHILGSLRRTEPEHNQLVSAFESLSFPIFNFLVDARNFGKGAPDYLVRVFLSHFQANALASLIHIARSTESDYANPHESILQDMTPGISGLFPITQFSALKHEIKNRAAEGKLPSIVIDPESLRGYPTLPAALLSVAGIDMLSRSQDLLDASRSLKTKGWTLEIGFAARAYRLETGHWPPDLTDLVPRYLDSIPSLEDKKDKQPQNTIFPWQFVDRPYLPIRVEPALVSNSLLNSETAQFCQPYLGKLLYDRNSNVMIRWFDGDTVEEHIWEPKLDHARFARDRLAALIERAAFAELMRRNPGDVIEDIYVEWRPASSGESVEWRRVDERMLDRAWELYLNPPDPPASPDAYGWGPPPEEAAGGSPGENFENMVTRLRATISLPRTAMAVTASGPMEEGHASHAPQRTVVFPGLWDWRSMQ